MPAGPINSVDEVFADPQVQARGIPFERRPSHGREGAQVANPLRLSASPVAYGHPPPLLGQHTDEVLTERLGLGEAEVARLRTGGIL